MTPLPPSLKIAFVDLTFNWPPVGGCWIDVHHVLKGFQQRGAAVKLFAPDFQEYYPRGSVRTELPYPVELIRFNRYTFHFKNVIQRFRKAVEAFQPDRIFIADGYHMKNHLLTAFEPERCFLRFYAYEMLCINLHYYRYHENRICDMGYFENPLECKRCWFRRMPAMGRALQIGLGWKETHPKLHFSQEYLGSFAFREAYREQLLHNFSSLRGAIVYNEFMKEKLHSYIDNIHVIPSGVDADAYTPAPNRKDSSQPVKIFLPGRANDFLKGLDVLLQAGEILAGEPLAFEIHYTAAMDCAAGQPWLINRGWVPQEELPSLYHEMDIVVVPSIWVEPFGITALEGMASGLPVVASRIGGLTHTVVDGETGLHVESGCAVSLANALRSLILDADLRQRLGENGRARVEQRYHWEAIVEAHYIPLLQDSISQKWGEGCSHEET
ncbi:glycosyltransferase [bacterium]|nr:glycosyltransferase [bacterium]